MIEPVTVLGQPAMRLKAPDGAEATVMLHGATVVSWIPAADQERLYLSPRAGAAPGQAVRGGVPVCWPQFNQRGRLPDHKHGFVRTRPWRWDAGQSTVRGGAAIGVLRLVDDEHTRAIWPRAFELELTLALSGLQLDIELAVRNSGEAPFDFTGALHTYLRVDDFRRARLSGLYGLAYHDSVHQADRRQELDPMGFVGHIDRIYWQAREPLALATAMGRMQIGAEGFDDVVVWNPGPETVARFDDLPAEDWTRFICVEAAAIGTPVLLQPGEEWAGRQTLEA